MKKIISIYTLLIFSILVKAQNVNIPDANFKTALVSLGSLNTNMDSEIQQSEAIAFTGLINCQSLGINDMTGIEEFVNITGLACGGNNITSIDLTNCMDLEYFECNNNNLFTLDVSQNNTLIDLDCGNNNLTSLDVSQNTNLEWLTCHFNSISSLNLSNNDSIRYLDVTSNQLNNLDVSNLSKLWHLDVGINNLQQINVLNNPILMDLLCYFNSIAELDVSNNPILNVLHAYDNQLYSLNVANGNNTNFINLLAENNPDLYCVQVDDSLYSLNNWDIIDSINFNFDDIVVFRESPCSSIEAFLTGELYIDVNGNCIHDTLEKNLRFIVVNGSSYSRTNNNGEYILGIDDSTNYLIEPIIPHKYENLVSGICPSNYNVSIINAVDTSGFDFGFDIEPCALLTVDISSNRRRRCFTNNTYLQYCNEGFADQDNVKVTVELPEYVSFVSANHAYTVVSDGNYIFDVGTVLAGECGTIHIVDSVACENGITGLTQCTKAWITPENSCAQVLDTTTADWDKSSVKVGGICVGDSIIRFTITNTGELGNGDMDGTSEYRIYIDNQLSHTATFQLVGGGTLVIEVPANGQTIRLEADQRPNHPGNSRPRETIEGCGNGGTPLIFDLPTQASSDDYDITIEEHCLPIIDSYDPNDKQVQPSGMTANNYVKPNSLLEYQIRFQNTGSDTAYKVVIVDTLDLNLDLVTLQWGISSHNYEVEVSGVGKPVLTFTFDDINLVDSLTDELGSQGFLKFKIAPYDDVSKGTVISNSADIYFDFNLPITTNEAWVTVYDTTITGPQIDVTVIEEVEEDGINFSSIKFNVLPNPFTKVFSIQIYDELVADVRLFDLLGKQVEIEKTIYNNSIIVNTLDLKEGIYLVNLVDKMGYVVGRTKIIKQ